MERKKILLVGCGKMGGALLGGMINAGVLAKNIMVVEPNIAAVNDRYNVKVLPEFDAKELDDFTPNVILLAVKPQVVESMLPDYKRYVDKSLFVSIIAGKTISFFEKHLGSEAAIIRTMPNLPVLIGKGAVVWYKNAAVTDKQVGVLEQLFASAGMLAKVDSEEMLDAVTAISGSGPAYVFYFMEALAEAGVKLGLPKDLATGLAVQTVVGSSELAANSDKALSQLRSDVTSPAGTTEAALKTLMKENVFSQLVVEAAESACLRSKELSD